MWNNRLVQRLPGIKYPGNLMVVGLLLLTILVSACAGLTRSDKPAARTWWLKPYTGMSYQVSANRVLVVAIEVTVSLGLDTNQILTLSDDGQINHYAAARWSDNLPELISSLSARSLQTSGHFDTISERIGNGHEDCDLRLELQEFFANTDSSGSTSGINITIDGQYQCESGVSMPVQLSATAPVHEDNMNAIVTAFQHGMDSVMEKLLRQLLLYAVAPAPAS